MSTASNTGRRGLPAVALRSRSAFVALTLFGLAFFAAPAWAQPSISSVEAPDAGQVVITFDQAIDTTTGSNPSNYQVFDTETPSTSYGIDEVTVNGAEATLVLADFLASGRNYTLRTQNVQASGGGPGMSLTTVTFDYPTASGATPIADIHADLGTYSGQSVTVEGVVYIPWGYRQPDTSVFSGYIQDSSGRGINVFGFSDNAFASDPALDTVGNLVRVTGTVELFNTTVEIADITAVEVLDTGQSVTAQQLSTGAAANSQWEGTFIEVTGTVSTSATGGPGVNYTVSDGSGSLVVRVVDTLGITSFSNGATITARGAGGQFGADFQILVGNSGDAFVSGGGDTTPPTVVGASAPGATSVSVNFSEAVDATTGGNASNYSVYPTASPGSPLTISGVSVSGASATLTLASSMVDGTAYTASVSGVEDNAGNAMVGTQTAAFTYSETSVTSIADIHANLGTYENTSVTVEGVVYIPWGYRQPDTSIFSGYIQGDSGRGINVFGFSDNPFASDPALDTVGTRVRVTGTVELFNTTVEIADITAVEVVSTGQTVTPQQLSTGAAANSQWEGTFIEITGTVSTSAVGGPGVNYTVNDGSGSLVVRVVDTLGVTSFANGETITARGAGGQFGSDFQILVGNSGDAFVSSGSDTTPPSVVGASGPSDTSVAVNFSETIDSTTGGNAANYSVYPTASPGSPIAVTGASVSGSSATLTLASAMVDGTGYTVAVTNVQDPAGNVLVGTQTAAFTYSASSVTSIADIHANLGTYENQTVTVEGVVYIPWGYRQPDTSIFSGYIQGDSGRGINVFGFSDNPFASNPALDTVGTRVRITGTVELFNTTVEIADLTDLQVIATGQTLTPQQLTTGAAANSQWEGTFIEVTGTVSAQAVGGPGTNYTVSDGSGSLIVRVVDTLGLANFPNGTTITARGAGGQFGSDFQILVGNASDAFVNGGGPDTTPPTVVGATASSATQVNVTFNEALDQATAQTASNYAVYPAGNPSSPIAVSSASLSGSSVSLTLAAQMTDETNYTVAVTGVQDTSGNTIAGNNTATFLYSSSGVTPIATIHANLSSYENQEVTIQGQVYIPWNYRQPDTSIFSGYIQDSSGRGINVFGFSDNPYASNPALNDVTAIVRLTGTIELFNTTVELADITDLEVISTGNTPLAPRQLSVPAAANSQWEGTFIEVNGQIQASSVGGPGVNLTLEEDGVLFTVRVVDTLGLTGLNIGTQIWARGAGGQFGSDFQLLVGRAEDLSFSPFPDRSPPSLLRAFLSDTRQVTLRFSEALDQTSAEDVGNYTVRAANGTTAEVTQALLSGGSSVLLSLDRIIDPVDNWTVTVVGVADESGLNAIPATAPEVATIQPPPSTSFTLDGPAATFLPREGETYPISVGVPEFIASQSGFNGELLLRVFDLQGRLQATLYDSKVDPASTDFADQSHTVEWNGLDEYANRVPAGAYIAHLRVVEEESGKTHDLQLPVVVAARLER